MVDKPPARALTCAASLTALAALLAGAACSGAGPGETEGDKAAAEQRSAPERKRAAPRLIGDGSTADTGPQPRQPEAEPLKPGEEPPQFVVFSWDGAAEDGNRHFSRFRKVARENDAHMTYFLTGLYLLPEDERFRYEPPGRRPGASDISYLKDENIAATLGELRGAWLDGSEIGTHFNGHFCGPEGVASWTEEDWRSEIDQASWMVRNWRTTTGFGDAEPLPFDYGEELAGGRTPCLEGRDALLPAAAEAGFRYDSSGSGLQVWPGRGEEGLWEFPLPSIPVPGRSFETLAMDYNFLANDAGGEDYRDGLLAAFDRAYHGNRAPLVVGNHFSDWNGGAYLDAVEEVIEEVCPREGVRCVSFRQLVDWLEAQDPAVLERLRGLGVGEAPADGWGAFLGGA